MNIIGYMIDIARGQRGDIPYLKEYISRLAGYGYNMVMLYLEYRFRFPSHPMLAAPDSLTPEGVRELDAFARELGIDLVPQVNCFGHIDGIGSLEKYKHLTADPSALEPWGAYESLNPFVPGSLQLVEELYRDIETCFTSKHLAIGGDEIRQMHVIMPDASEEERLNVMFDYLDKVFDIVLKLGKIPMMWGDLLALHPQMLHRIPKNVIIMDWEYFKPSKLDSLRMFRDAGYKVLMCPSTNTWAGHPALLLLGLANARLTREAREEKAEGICLTTWENDAGACDAFGWPLAMLNAEVARGNDAMMETICDEYPKREWGVEDACFGKYLDLIEKQTLETLACSELTWEAAVAYPFFHIRNQIMRTHNILPMLWHTVQSAFSRERRDRVRPLVTQALEIAENFAERATKRKDEAALWPQATRLMLTMIEMGDEIENLAAAYHEAALHQGEDDASFARAMQKVYSSLEKMARLVEPFRVWAEKMVAEHNHAEQECWWPPRAQQNLRDRSCELKKLVEAGYPLLTFDRFINDIPGVPTRVMWR